MRSEHGNKPWTTPFKHDTHGGMATDQRQVESIAIIRAQSMKTGRIKEFAYKQDIACRDRIRSMLETHEMTICTDEIIGCINYDPTAD